MEIVRCLLQEPRLIIMDEPTSVLTPQEADLLFVTLRRLSGEGSPSSTSRTGSMRCCDSATAPPSCASGKLVATADPRQESAGEPRAHDGGLGGGRSCAAERPDAGTRPRSC